MGRRWKPQEEAAYRKELKHLYVDGNLTIREVADILGLSYQAVYDRLVRLGISTNPDAKVSSARRRRSDIALPRKRSAKLAEFFGVMLGDGALNKYQTVVTLGTKEEDYVRYVSELFGTLFSVKGTVHLRRGGSRDVYVGSRTLVEWLISEGLTRNKVKGQVGVPDWILGKKAYMDAFLRGFFDTDGTIYRLRFGVQVAFCNHSLPLLYAVREMLQMLEYYPSQRSGWQLYLTRRKDILRFFREVKPANRKHVQRFTEFMAR